MIASLETIMRVAICLLVLFGCGQSQASDVLFYRTESGLIRCWPEKGDLPTPKHSSWEGSGSRVTFEQSTDRIKITWKIDESGPYWVFVEVEQTPKGITAHAWHSNNHWNHIDQFHDYGELLASSRMSAVIVKQMIGLNGQSAYLLTPSAMRTLLDSPPVAPDKATLTQAQSILVQADDDDWRVRCAAANALREQRFIPAVLLLAQSNDLTPQQQATIELICNGYAYSPPKGFIEALKSGNLAK